MDLVSGFLVFLFGVICGAAIMLLRNKFSGENQQVQSALQACEQQNAQLKQEWQDHIATFRSVATNLDEMSRHIQQQIDDSEQMLTQPNNKSHFPFFSKEATQFLQNADSDKRQTSSVSNQPLDYSGSASGLFQGQEAATVNGSTADPKSN